MPMQSYTSKQTFKLFDNKDGIVLDYDSNISAETHKAGDTSQYFRIPTAIQITTGDKFGRIVAAYDVRWNSSSDHGMNGRSYDICIGSSYSDDNGQTWSRPKIIQDWKYTDNELCIQTGVEDTTLLYDDENNCIFAFSIAGPSLGDNSSSGNELNSARRSQLALSYSLDSGETWTQCSCSMNTKICADIAVDGIEMSAYEETDGWHGWEYTSQHTAGMKYLFGGLGNGIKLKYQKGEYSRFNGYFAIPIQYWTKGPTVAGRIRSSNFMYFKPTYLHENNDENSPIIALNVDELHFTIPDASQIKFRYQSIPDNPIYETSECSICETEIGELIVVSRGYVSHNSSKLRLTKSADFGHTWTCIGDVDGELTGDKVISTIPKSIECKPNLFFREYDRYFYLSYQQPSTDKYNNYYRDNLIIKRSRDLINWSVFDIVSPAKTAGYSTMISMDKGGSIGVIYESTDANTQIYNKIFEFTRYCFWGDMSNNIGNNVLGSKTTNLTDIYSSYHEEQHTYHTLGYDKYYHMFTVVDPSTLTEDSEIITDAISLYAGAARTNPYKIAIFENDVDADLSNAECIATSEQCQAEQIFASSKVTFNFDKPIVLHSSKRYYICPFDCSQFVTIDNLSAGNFVFKQFYPIETDSTGALYEANDISCVVADTAPDIVKATGRNTGEVYAISATYVGEESFEFNQLYYLSRDRNYPERTLSAYIAGDENTVLTCNIPECNHGINYVKCNFGNDTLTVAKDDTIVLSSSALFGITVFEPGNVKSTNFSTLKLHGKTASSIDWSDAHIMSFKFANTNIEADEMTKTKNTVTIIELDNCKYKYNALYKSFVYNTVHSVDQQGNVFFSKNGDDTSILTFVKADPVKYKTIASIAVNNSLRYNIMNMSLSQLTY